MKISDDPYVNLFESAITRRIAKNCMDAVETVTASDDRPDVDCSVFWSKPEGSPCIGVTIYNGDESDDDPSHDGLGVNDRVDIWGSPGRAQIERDLRAAVARIDEEIARRRKALLAASSSEAAK